MGNGRAQIRVNYEGEYLDPIRTTLHKRIWAKSMLINMDNRIIHIIRGRVNINKGVAYVNINSLMNCPHIIDEIIEASTLGNSTELTSMTHIKAVTMISD